MSRLELDGSRWKLRQSPPPPQLLLRYTQMHARTCQLQARRRLSPDGGELHNSRMCPCSEGMPARPLQFPVELAKKTERGRAAHHLLTLKALSCPLFLQNSHHTVQPPPMEIRVLTPGHWSGLRLMGAMGGLIHHRSVQ